MRVAPRWTTWTFSALIGGLAALVVASSLIRIDTEVRGVAAVDPGGHVVVLVPAALGPQIGTRSPVRVNGTTTRVRSFGEVVDPEQAAQRYGVDVAVPTLEVLTAERAHRDVHGAPAVVTVSQRLVVALVPGLGPLLGR